MLLFITIPPPVITPPLRPMVAFVMIPPPLFCAMLFIPSIAPLPIEPTTTLFAILWFIGSRFGLLLAIGPIPMICCPAIFLLPCCCMIWFSCCCRSAICWAMLDVPPGSSPPFICGPGPGPGGLLPPASESTHVLSTISSSGRWLSRSNIWSMIISSRILARFSGGSSM